MERVRLDPQKQGLKLIWDLVVVGAGIHGAFLLRRALRDRIVTTSRALWLDTEAQPFAVWRRRTHNCRMDFLRSPASHGLDRDFRALRRDLDDPTRFALPYHRPAVAVFEHHLDETTDELLSRVAYRQTTVRYVERVANGHWSVVCSDGSIAARRVILALGQPEPYLPAPLRVYQDAGMPVYHLYDRLIPDSVREAPTLLIGNGIGATHFALWYADAERPIDWWARSAPTVYDFDSDPAYIGPKGQAELDNARCGQTMPALLGHARRRGSIPPGLAQRLKATPPRFVRQRRAALAGVRHDGHRFIARGVTGEIARPEVIVVATGFTSGPPARTFIAASAQRGLRTDNTGYPLLDDSLQWAPGLFVSGGLAEMVLGPPARNIIGAHLAGRRIVPALLRTTSGVGVTSATL